MTPDLPSWLDGAVALIVGDCGARDALVGALGRAGAHTVMADYASSLEEASQRVDKASAEGPLVNLLIHIEPSACSVSAEELSSQEWRDWMGAALDSAFFYASAVAQALFAQGKQGDILFLSRPAGASGVAGFAAGGGLRNLVHTLAVEWARDGLRINAVESSLLDGGGETEMASLGGLCSYLLSDFAGYVTGTVMGVDDGIEAPAARGGG